MTEVPLNDAERAARDVRRTLGLGEAAPVTDLLGLAEDRLGVPVLLERFETDAIAGVLLRRAGGDAFVAINADHGPVKQRFTLAHELGHLHLGHQPRVDLTVDVFGGRSRDPQEIAANYFAAEFLAPRPGIRAWLEDRDLIGQIDASVVARLALTFGTAFPTTCYRLERAGLISAASKRLLVGELGANGASYARQNADARLLDVLESLWRDETYPRVPRETRRYADEALEAELIDADEHRKLVSQASGVDVGPWFS